LQVVIIRSRRAITQSLAPRGDRISQRVAGFLERDGLLVTDDDNDYLALDGLEDDPMLQIHGYSITYRIATGKQQGRKVFTLQKALHLWHSSGLRKAASLFIVKKVSLWSIRKGW
jgi:hypothetical protein